MTNNIRDIKQYNSIDSAPTRVSITDEEQTYFSWNEHSKPLRNKGNRIAGQILHDFNDLTNQGDQEYLSLQTYFQIFFNSFPKLSSEFLEFL